MLEDEEEHLDSMIYHKKCKRSVKAKQKRRRFKLRPSEINEESSHVSIILDSESENSLNSFNEEFRDLNFSEVQILTVNKPIQPDKEFVIEVKEKKIVEKPLLLKLKDTLKVRIC